MVVSQKVLVLLVSVHPIDDDRIGSDSPLECQVQEHEENTESISNPVLCTGVFSGHGCQTGCGDDDANEAGDVHAPARVDPVVKPGAKRVVNDT